MGGTSHRPRPTPLRVRPHYAPEGVERSRGIEPLRLRWQRSSRPTWTFASQAWRRSRTLTSPSVQKGGQSWSKWGELNPLVLGGSQMPNRSATLAWSCTWESNPPHTSLPRRCLPTRTSTARELPRGVEPLTFPLQEGCTSSCATTARLTSPSHDQASGREEREASGVRGTRTPIASLQS